MPESWSSFVVDYLALIRKNLRDMRGDMTQDKFASEVGVSRTTIQRIEDGKNFEIVSLLKIAEYLGIQPYVICIDAKKRAEIEGQVSVYRNAFKQEIIEDFRAELVKFQKEIRAEIKKS